MTITLHGIKNCDSVKKARQWLSAAGIDYEFRDFRAAAPTAAEIQSWLEHCEWQQVLNKRSTTWKSLGEGDKAGVNDAATALKLLAANPTLIKRPVLTTTDGVWIGFNSAHYERLFKPSID